MTIFSMQSVQPVRRDLHFKLSAERIANWHPRGVEVTLFFGALSIFFPEGERMFIRAVRHFRDQINDPELVEQVAGFIAQEAMHGREHQMYNDLLRATGLPVTELEEFTKSRVALVESDNCPPHVRLAVTMALEHWTAILADFILREPAMLGDADPEYQQLWQWHALEETEHKAVAFDVYRNVIGARSSTYWLRVSTMLTVTTNFWYDTYRTHRRLLQAHRARTGEAPFDVRKVLNFLHFAFISPGPLRRIIPAWAAYFRPGFHPWQHDNRRYLSQLQALQRSVEQGLAAVT